MSNYVGINGLSQEITGGYIGVNGVAKEIVAAYLGVNGIAKPIWDIGKFISGTVTATSALTLTITGIGFTPNRVMLVSNTAVATSTSTTAYIMSLYGTNTSVWATTSTNSSYSVSSYQNGRVAKGDKIVTFGDGTITITNNSGSYYFQAGTYYYIAWQEKVVSEPYPTGTTMLLHFDDNLDDAVGSNVPLIRTSAGEIGAATYNVEGMFKSSIVLDGTNCVQIPYNADAFGFTNQDWTVTAWVKRNTVTTGVWQMLFNYRKYYSSLYTYSGWDVGISRATTPMLEFQIYTTYSTAKSVLTLSADSVLPNNVWTHIAVVKSGTNAYLFANGVKKYTLALGTDTIYNPETLLTVGGMHDSTTSDETKVSNLFEGEIDEVLVVNGVALWTEDFDPPERAYKEPPMKRVGGTIFYIGSDNGNTYRFFDKDKNEITDITTTGLADAYYYTVEGEATTDRFYVWDEVVPSSGTWGYSGTSLGATGTAIGTGKANTETVLARTDIPTGSIWELIKKKRTERINGCSDWYIGSDSEVAKFISSYSSKYQSYPFWSSSESSADNAYQWYYTYNNRSGTTSKGWGASAKSGNGAVVAIRSF